MSLLHDQLSISRRDDNSLRVTSRLDKVDASVNTVIDEFEPVDSVFLLEIRVESGINILDNGFPAITSQLVAHLTNVEAEPTSHHC